MVNSGASERSTLREIPPTEVPVSQAAPGRKQAGAAPRMYPRALDGVAFLCDLLCAPREAARQKCDPRQALVPCVSSRRLHTSPLA